MENMTIKRRTEGFGLKWPRDGVAATLFEGIWDEFFSVGGVTCSSDAAAHNVIPSTCIRFEAATRPRFLRVV